MNLHTINFETHEREEFKKWLEEIRFRDFTWELTENSAKCRYKNSQNDNWTHLDRVVYEEYMNEWKYRTGNQ